MQKLANTKIFLRETKTKYLVDGINKINSFNLFKIFSLGSIFWIAFTKHETIKAAEEIDANSMSYFKILYHALLKHYNLSNFEYNSNKITWYGVDISEMFNELSIMLHKDLDVKTSLDTSILPKVVDVFFSKGITLLYAIRDVNSLFKTINSGRLSIFDYSFSLKHNEDITIGSGKTVRYLFLNDFINELNNNNTKLFLVKKANSKFIEDHNRLWLDCVYGEIDLVKNFVKEEIKIRNNIYNQMSVYPNSNRFLNKENISEWVTIEDYINTLNK